MVVLSSFAEVAPQAGDTWLESNPVSNLVRVHTRAHLSHDTGALMAETHGLREDKVADTAVAPVVHVTAADT